MKNRRLPLDKQDGIFNPRLGRFVQADNIVPNFTKPQNLNRFTYVANNPISLIDPTGETEMYCIQGSICTEDFEVAFYYYLWDEEYEKIENILRKASKGPSRGRIDTDTLRDIATVVFAETRNGTYDDDILALHFWALLNRTATIEQLLLARASSLKALEAI